VDTPPNARFTAVTRELVNDDGPEVARHLGGEVLALLREPGIEYVVVRLLPANAPATHEDGNGN